MTKYYLAGPMTGLPFANIPAFDAASALLRSKGLDITSPAELDDAKIREESVRDETGLAHAGSWGEFLARDVKILADELDAVICLPGWERSRGANLEVFVAMLSKKPIYFYAPGTAEGMVPMTTTYAMKHLDARLHGYGLEVKVYA